jgi:integrase
MQAKRLGPKTTTKPAKWPAETFTSLVHDYLQDKRAAGASPRTVNHYQEVLEQVLLPFCAEQGITGPADLTTRHLNDLGAGHLDGSRSRSGRPISKATVHGYMRAINGFLSWTRTQGGGGEARGRLPSMRKRVLDTLTREEIQRMEDSADSERDKLIVRLLADTGIRLGELIALQPDDVRVEGGKKVLKVRGKGDRERLVPLSPSLSQRLKRFTDRACGEASSERLFLTLRRGRDSGKLDAITESAVEQMIRALGEVAGIKKRSTRTSFDTPLPPTTSAEAATRSCCSRSSVILRWP